MTEVKPYRKFATGVFLVRAENANFNADFSGYPRTLPDGTIFATDKALKYCVRKYWHDFLYDEDGDLVLMWRRYDRDKVFNLDKDITRIIYPSSNNTNSANNLSNTPLSVLRKDILKKCIDVRVFGATLTLKSRNEGNDRDNKNFSITGPCQISYGVNVFPENEIYSLQILSPKPSSNDKNQFTIGSETRAKEVHYSYDFVINPNTLLMDEQLNSTIGENEQNNLGGAMDNLKDVLLSEKDVEHFKEGLIRGVNYVISTTKATAVSEMLLFVEFEMQGSKVPLIPILNKHVKVSNESEDKKREVDISEVVEILKGLKTSNGKDEISKIELYYDPEMTVVPAKEKLKDITKNYNEFHIITKEKLNQDNTQ